ncbi:MAG TPA: family 1 encapsulin nanocompartment shell protein [Acidimicrobiales bacterium]|nr:family 1 encapsulin nanocompartment shell protein [Acidimicrobiales bacterium]
MADRLRRHLAPLSDAAWRAVDEEAARALRHHLTGRVLVDFTGPKGWAHAAEADGRVEEASSPVPGVEVRSRVVVPVRELRAPFSLSLAELDRVDRGYPDPDLDALDEAARAAASAENRSLLGQMAAASPHEPVAISDDYHAYPRHVAQAVALLRRAGVGGPYGIALGDRCYTGVIETTEHGGYPVLEHVRLVLGGPVVWAPDVDGALVVSTRGGDFELVCGADFAVGYSSHGAGAVELYLEESYAFVVHEPRAAAALRYGR